VIKRQKNDKIAAAAAAAAVVVVVVVAARKPRINSWRWRWCKEKERNDDDPSVCAFSYTSPFTRRLQNLERVE